MICFSRGCLTTHKKVSLFAKTGFLFFSNEPKCKDAQTFNQQMSADFAFQTLLADSSTAAISTFINSRNWSCPMKKDTSAAAPTPPKIKSSFPTISDGKIISVMTPKRITTRVVKLTMIASLWFTPAPAAPRRFWRTPASRILSASLARRAR